MYPNSQVSPQYAPPPIGGMYPQQQQQQPGPEQHFAQVLSNFLERLLEKMAQEGTEGITPQERETIRQMFYQNIDTVGQSLSRTFNTNQLNEQQISQGISDMIISTLRDLRAKAQQNRQQAMNYQPGMNNNCTFATPPQENNFSYSLEQEYDRIGEAEQQQQQQQQVRKQQTYQPPSPTNIAPKQIIKGFDKMNVHELSMSIMSEKTNKAGLLVRFRNDSAPENQTEECCRISSVWDKPFDSEMNMAITEKMIVDSMTTVNKINPLMAAEGYTFKVFRYAESGMAGILEGIQELIEGTTSDGRNDLVDIVYKIYNYLEQRPSIVAKEIDRLCSQYIYRTVGLGIMGKDLPINRVDTFSDLTILADPDQVPGLRSDCREIWESRILAIIGGFLDMLTRIEIVSFKDKCTLPFALEAVMMREGPKAQQDLEKCFSILGSTEPTRTEQNNKDLLELQNQAKHYTVIKIPTNVMVVDSPYELLLQQTDAVNIPSVADANRRFNSTPIYREANSDPLCYMLGGILKKGETVPLYTIRDNIVVRTFVGSTLEEPYQLMFSTE